MHDFRRTTVRKRPNVVALALHSGNDPVANVGSGRKPTLSGPLRPSISAIRERPGVAICAAQSVSLDHLIRAQQQRGRDRQTEGFGRSQIHHQFVLTWLLNREFARRRSLEDPIDVDGRARIQFDVVRAVLFCPSL